MLAEERGYLVIELIGGTTFAKEVVIGALQNGKSVVTANKALMASCGEEVMSLAEEKGVEIAFEASVGGAIPIIVPLKHSLIANRIDSIMGIVNGTTNYMLTRMDEDGIPLLILSTWLGGLIQKRISQEQFVKFTYVLLTVIGCVLLIK